MTALIDAEVSLARPGKVVYFDVCEHEHGYVELSDRFVLGQLPVVLEQIAEMVSVISVELLDVGMFDVVDHFTKTLQVTSSW